MNHSHKTPFLYLFFANAKGLENLKPERLAIQKILGDAQKYGQIQIDNEAETETSDFFELFRQDRQVDILHYAGHANPSGLALLDSLFSAETLQKLTEIVAKEKPDAFRLVFLNGCATEEIARKLITAGAKCVIATPRPIGDESASLFAQSFYKSLAERNTLTFAFDYACQEIKRNNPEASTRMSSHIEGVAISEWKIFYKDDDESWGDWKLPPKLIYKKHLLDIPFIPEVFIGREENLEELHDKLFNPNEDNMLLLVNGQGGIGKTTLASKYYQDYQNKYTYLAWALAEPSIAEAVLRLAAPLEVDFPNEMVETKERLNLLITKMANLDKPCLLVLDNANDIEDLEKYYLLLRKCTNFHLLLTSRINEYAQANTYKINSLSKENALKLFMKYFPQHKEEENILFENIYDAIDGNTLVIEVFAKNLQTWIQTRKTAYTLKNLYQDINNKGLLQVQSKTEVLVAWQTKGTALNKDKPERLLEAMYDLGELTEEEKQLLSNFAVLPPENIPFEILEELKPKTFTVFKKTNFFQRLFKIKTQKKEAFSKELFDNTLFALAQKGWLDHNQETDSYKVSPVVQEITKHKNQDRLPQDCQALLDKLYFLLETDNNTYLRNIFLQQASVYYPFAQAVFLNMPEKSYTLGWLGIYLGDYDNSIGNLMKARESFESAKAIFQEIKKDYSYGISLERLGNSFSATGNLEQALKYYAEDRDLKERMCQENPNNSDYKNSLAISYQNLGDTHSKLGNLEKVLEFFEVYNRLEKELYESYPEQVGFKNGLAISYQYLGITHSKLGNLEKALEFFEAYMKLKKELYESYPEQVGFKNGLAISYQHLGNTHRALGNLEKALEFFEAYNRLEKELYAAYPEQVEFKNLLAISYIKLGYHAEQTNDKEKAKMYYLECKKHYLELVQSFPAYAAFQKNLQLVESRLLNLKVNQFE